MAIAFERASDKFLETTHRPSVRSNVGILAMLAGEGSTPTSGPDASRNPRRGVRDRSRGMGDHLGMQQHARRSWALSRLLALGLVGAACSAPARPAVPPAPAQPSVPPAPTPASGPLPITALVAGCQLQGGAVLCWGGRGCGGGRACEAGFPSRDWIQCASPNNAVYKPSRKDDRGRPANERSLPRFRTAISVGK